MSRYSQEDKKDDVQAYVGSPAVAEYDTEKGMAVVDGHTAILVNEPRKSRICSSRLSLTSLVNAAEGGVHRTQTAAHGDDRDRRCDRYRYAARAPTLFTADSIA